MVERTVGADGAIHLVDDGCAARVELLKPGVFFGTMVGASTTELDKQVMSELEREIARRGSIRLYFDGRAQSRLRPRTKDVAVEWGKKHMGRIDAHLLLNSKLLEMALRVIGMFVGMPIHIYSNESEFLALVKREAPNFGPLPIIPVRHAKAEAAQKPAAR